MRPICCLHACMLTAARSRLFNFGGRGASTRRTGYPQGAEERKKERKKERQRKTEKDSERNIAALVHAVACAAGAMGHGGRTDAWKRCKCVSVGWGGVMTYGWIDGDNSGTRRYGTAAIRQWCKWAVHFVMPRSVNSCIRPFFFFLCVRSVCS